MPSAASALDQFAPVHSRSAWWRLIARPRRGSPRRTRGSAPPGCRLGSGARAHAAADDHRLPNAPIALGKAACPGPKRARCALRLYVQQARLAVDDMGLDLQVLCEMSYKFPAGSAALRQTLRARGE